MANDEEMVQPVRTYLEGSDLKEPHHEPYVVNRHRADDLRRNGLVAPVQGDSEAKSEPEVSKPSGRRQRGA